MKAKIKATTRQEELMYAFNFSLHDLATHQEGRVSESHYRSIIKQKEQEWTVEEFWGSILIVVAILSLFAGGYWLLTTKSLNALITTGISVPVPLLIGGLLILKGQRRIRKISKELFIVESVQGIVVLDEIKGGFSIGSLFFTVERHALLRIKHLEPHIVYFLPRSKIIVSVEVVES